MDVVSVLATNFTKLQYTSLLTGYTFVIICYSDSQTCESLFYLFQLHVIDSQPKNVE